LKERPGSVAVCDLSYRACKDALRADDLGRGGAIGEGLESTRREPRQAEGVGKKERDAGDYSCGIRASAHSRSPQLPDWVHNFCLGQIEDSGTPWLERVEEVILAPESESRLSYSRALAGSSCLGAGRAPAPASDVMQPCCLGSGNRRDSSPRSTLIRHRSLECA